MESSQELIEELKFNDKWLSEEYKNSTEYREYLEVICNQLKRCTEETDTQQD